jgi:hypothetical protein
MTQDALSILDGRTDPPPELRTLRAGPLSVVFESGDLRYLRLGDRELIRRIYMAVWDRNWETVPARLIDLIIDEQPDRFLIRYVAEHAKGPVDFVWKATIEGRPDGSLRFAMDGAARSTFLRNRIGFCVLHPIRECAGAWCRLTHVDGTTRETEFPWFVAPHNPFLELVGLSHEVLPRVWVDLQFEGEVFETEDQRNWIDGSFKTFCTPLRMPFPIEIQSGTKVCQAVTLTITGPTSRSPRSDRAIRFQFLSDLAVPVPDIGLGLSADSPLPSASQRDLIRRLNLSHLRVELDLGQPGWQDFLGRAFADAAAMDCLVDVAFTTGDQGTADDEMRRLAKAASAQRHRIGRLLVFSRIAWSTPAALVKRARQILGPIDARIPLIAGTIANFLELNRADLPWDQLDGLCFSAHPQEHTFDNASMIENLEGLASAIESARELSAGLPVEVGPITLRKRVNPYATGPASEPEPGKLPARVDPRQMSLFGAAWTLGAIKHLAEQRAARATFYETTGWLGVMEAEGGPPLPERFPSIPGQVFPMFHVFADVNEFRGGEILLSRSSQPLAIDGLVLRRGTARRVLLANFTPKDLEIRIDGLGRQARIRRLDATNAVQDAEAARRFRADPGTAHATVGRGYPLSLGPYALARLDTE